MVRLHDNYTEVMPPGCKVTSFLSGIYIVAAITGEVVKKAMDSQEMEAENEVGGRFQTGL